MVHIMKTGYKWYTLCKQNTNGIHCKKQNTNGTHYENRIQMVPIVKTGYTLYTL